MGNTVWISNIQYEQFIANHFVQRTFNDMNNSHYTKDHTLLSASAISNDMNEAEDSCERVFNYVEINIEKKCKDMY